MTIVPMPFDMLMRPIKYVEGGDIFVSPAFRGVGFSGSIVVLLDDDPTIKSNNWHEAATITDSLPLVAPMCGAYGLAGADPRKPTYVIGGASSKLEEPDPDQLQLIVTSHDGVKWTKSRRGPTGFVYVMGWDEKKKKFCAQAVANNFERIDVLESTDGISWDTADSHTLDPENQVWASPQLQATGLPEIKDEAGNIVPNGGIFGWDQNKNIWIAPRPVGTYRWYSEPDDDDKRSNVVDIIKKTIDPKTGAETTTKTTRTLPMSVVQYVGTTQGIWQAAGYDESGGEVGDSVFAKSTDDGKTWKVVFSTDLRTFAMMGGAKS